MNEQTELKQLVEKGLMVINEGLEDKIKEEERVKEALKNNTKTRVTAIAKMQKDIMSLAKKQKTSLDMDRMLKLMGCGKCGDMFTFTDGYKIFWLNNSLGYEPIEDYVDTSKHLPTSEVLENCPTIDEKDLKYLIKLKEHYVVTDSLLFNYKQIEQALKIIGSSNIYYIAGRSCLYFENKVSKESCLLIGVKYTTTQ